MMISSPSLACFVNFAVDRGLFFQKNATWLVRAANVIRPDTNKTS